MWDLPGPGLEPVSPALAGGFLTTVPPGKSRYNVFKKPLLSLSHVFVFILYGIYTFSFLCFWINLAWRFACFTSLFKEPAFWFAYSISLLSSVSISVPIIIFYPCLLSVCFLYESVFLLIP